MNFSSYADFRDKFQVMFDGDDISTSDLSGDVLDLIIAAGEVQIYRNLRSTTQETVLSATVTGNLAPMPADFLELKGSLYLGNGFATASYAPWQQVTDAIQTNASSVSAAPKLYTTQGDSFLFYPPQGDGVIVTGTYYKRFPDIKSGLNAFFNRHPDLFLYSSLSQSAPFLGEMERLPIWQQMYTDILGSANEQELRRRTRGSKLQTRVG